VENQLVALSRRRRGNVGECGGLVVQLRRLWGRVCVCVCVCMYAYVFAPRCRARITMYGHEDRRQTQRANHMRGERRATPDLVLLRELGDVAAVLPIYQFALDPCP